MDYLCAKFGDFSFSRFGFIVRTDRHTNIITESQTDRITEADDRYTHATTVGVCNLKTLVLKPMPYCCCQSNVHSGVIVISVKMSALGTPVTLTFAFEPPKP